MAFSHEKLIVYQEAISFVEWATDLIHDLPAGSSCIKNQLERAAISIPLNIAEGNGKFSKKDRCRFFQIAHGSAVERAACLDVICAQNLRAANELAQGKDQLKKIVNLLYGLLSRFESRLIQEDGASYGPILHLVEGDQEED